MDVEEVKGRTQLLLVHVHAAEFVPRHHVPVLRRLGVLRHGTNGLRFYLALFVGAHPRTLQQYDGADSGAAVHRGGPGASPTRGRRVRMHFCATVAHMHALRAESGLPPAPHFPRAAPSGAAIRQGPGDTRASAGPRIAGPCRMLQQTGRGVLERLPHAPSCTCAPACLRACPLAQDAVSAFQAGAGTCAARGHERRPAAKCLLAARSAGRLHGLRPTPRLRRGACAPPAMVMTGDTTGVVVEEACPEDLAAIAKVSMDAFYGRPWKLGETLPWIATEKQGLARILEQIRLIFARYERPDGNAYAGFEYVWNRKQVSRPSACHRAGTKGSRHGRAAVR